MDNSSKLNKPNIMVTSQPFTSISGQATLTYLIDVLRPLSQEIFVTTGNKFSYEPNDKIHIERIDGIDQHDSMFSWISKQILIQVNVCNNILKLHKDVDIFIFYLGARSYLFPILCAKILRKKTVVTATGSASKTTKGTYSKFGIGKRFLPMIVGFFEKSGFLITDRIIVESESSIKFLGLGKFRKKISVTGVVYIDTNKFKIEKSVKDKRNLIGYIGRLSSEKGVSNFLEAIPIILKERGDPDFFIGGDGPLIEEIKKELTSNGLCEKVELPGWINRDELPDYLNNLKFIVSPSYTEGGVPAVIMEAMACGAIVLVTPVAAADIIKDAESGFILKDNSPECIASNVIRALTYPNLDKIVINAQNLVEEEFSYKDIVRRYSKMLNEMLL